MIYLLHGDDTTSSRRALGEYADGYSVTTLDGKTLTIPVFENSLFSESLFAEKKAVVIENFFSQNKKKKEIIAFLNSIKPTILLLFWEDKKLTKAAVSQLNAATVKEFSLPTYYFQFLDLFAPSNKKKVFALYHDLLKSYAPEQILFSLIKRIRLLIMISSNSRADEVAKQAPWLQSKLKQQVRLWDESVLIAFYKSLQDAEIKLKTGALPVDLSKHLDILILSKL